MTGSIMPHRRALRVLFSVTIALALPAILSVSPSPVSATPGAPTPITVTTPGVVPVVARPYGLSYGEWSARWWQWAYSLPATGHPLFDETGADAANGQSGPVWFLGGVFNVSGTASRVVTVPSGKALFFPILNVEWDNVCPPGSLTVDELRALAAAVADAAVDLQCEFDGQEVEDLPGYRVTSPVFQATFPDDNLYQAFGCGTAPGVYAPLVGDGFYVMLEPPSVGTHQLHFHGSVGPPVNFTLDIHYELHVVGAGRRLADGSAEPMGVPAVVGGSRPITWGRLKTLYR